MNESGDRMGLEDKRLSLIDVSFEDDCLYSSPPRDNRHFSNNPTERRSDKAVGLVGDEIVQSSEDFSFEAAGTKVTQLLQSPEVTSQNGKYNLRNSLAWDSAFFTSAGVLEPEELSCMIVGVQKGGKCMLPGIQEDVHKSSDSISTLASDNLVMETLEADLFGDIRASIQKSTKSSAAAAPLTNSVASESAETRKANQSSEKGDTTQNKLKAKATANKPNVAMCGSGKLSKQVTVSSRGSQFAATDGDLPSSLAKPPKAVGRLSTYVTPAAKRGSLGAHKVKVEKDDSKLATGNLDHSKKSIGKGGKIAASSGLQNSLSRPSLPSRPPSSSSNAKRREITTSSSCDSSESLSSDSSNISSSSSVKRVIGSKSGIHSSSGSIIKNALRVGPKSKAQLITPRLSPHLKSVSKLSSTISPTSSVSEWSSGSLSPTSTLNKSNNNSRPSIDETSRRAASGDHDAMKDLELNDHFIQNCEINASTQVDEKLGGNIKRVSTGSSRILPPDSLKPTGLRMPSPKIGFFDGVRSAVRTPNRSVCPHPAVLNGLPRSGTDSVSPNEGPNKTKLGRLQPVRTLAAVRSSKIGAQQHALGVKSKSLPPFQESPNSVQKVCDASKNENRSPDMSFEVQNRKSPEKTSIRDPVSNLNGNKTSLESKSDAFVNDAAITTVNGGVDHTSNKSSVSEVENLSLQKVGGDATDCRNQLNNNLDSLCVINGGTRIETGDQKESAADCASLKIVGDVDFSGPEETQTSANSVVPLTPSQGNRSLFK